MTPSFDQYYKKYKILNVDATSWIEPMREWVETASILDEIAKRNDLPSKKSALQKIFGSNLTLHDKKVRENPSPAYAALSAARLNYSDSDTSFILPDLESNQD